MVNTVCIDGLPLWVREPDLHRLCERWGEVVSVRVVHDAYGASVGYGFVEMATRQDAEELVRCLNQRWAFERCLYVARTYPVSDSQSLTPR